MEMLRLFVKRGDGMWSTAKAQGKTGEQRWSFNGGQEKGHSEAVSSNTQLTGFKTTRLPLIRESP